MFFFLKRNAQHSDDQVASPADILTGASRVPALRPKSGRNEHKCERVCIRPNLAVAKTRDAPLRMSVGEANDQGTSSLIQDSHEGYDRFKSVSWLNSAIKEFFLSLTEPKSVKVVQEANFVILIKMRIKITGKRNQTPGGLL